MVAKIITKDMLCVKNESTTFGLRICKKFMNFYTSGHKPISCSKMTKQNTYSMLALLFQNVSLKYWSSLRQRLAQIHQQLAQC